MSWQSKCAPDITKCVPRGASPRRGPLLIMTYAVFQRELRFEGRITQALQMVLEEEDQAAVESSLFSGTRRWKSWVRGLPPAGAPDTAERIGMDAWSPLSNIPGSFPQKVQSNNPNAHCVSSPSLFWSLHSQSAHCKIHLAPMFSPESLFLLLKIMPKRNNRNPIPIKHYLPLLPSPGPWKLPFRFDETDYLDTSYTRK